MGFLAREERSNVLVRKEANRRSRLLWDIGAGEGEREEPRSGGLGVRFEVEGEEEVGREERRCGAFDTDG